MSRKVFRLDPRIGDVFAAHLEAIMAPTRKSEDAAIARRDMFLSRLDDEQISYAIVIASGLNRLCTGVELKRQRRPRKAKTTRQATRPPLAVVRAA